MVTFFSLENGPDVWAKKICDLLKTPVNRHDISRLMRGTAFDSEITASKLLQAISDWSHDE